MTKQNELPYFEDSETQEAFEMLMSKRVTPDCYAECYERYWGRQLEIFKEIMKSQNHIFTTERCLFEGDCSKTRKAQCDKYEKLWCDKYDAPE